MSRVLLVDDDPDQLAVRELIFQHEGHSVASAGDVATARSKFAEHAPDLVVLDLRLPSAEDGFELIREFREQRPAVRLVVLSGWISDVANRPEAKMVDGILAKPVRSEKLLRIAAKFAICLLCVLPAFAAEHPFNSPRDGEARADVTVSAPDTRWSRPGREATMVDVRVDSGTPFQVMLFAGDQPHQYSVFLGRVTAGRHVLSITPDKAIRFRDVKIHAGLDDPILAHAPILYARVNTIGKFTDVPLLVYAEKDGSILQYTVIFSNEDGGTSTRALMARWGRTTDIEYVYKLDLTTNRATIQAKDHKEVEFKGRREGDHPILIPSTDNNMVSDEGSSPVRYQIAPILADLSSHSREMVMDERPVTYRVASEELEREGKLRPFGTVDGEKISDPRNYLYVELKSQNTNAAVAVHVRLRGDSRSYTSDLGRYDYAIARSGWARTTVELPPGTTREQIGEITLACIVIPDRDRKLPVAGTCNVEALGKVFFLDRDYKPGETIFHLPASVKLVTGEIRSFPR